MISLISAPVRATAEPTLTPIPKIQGVADVSPLDGKVVTTSGVVTAIETFSDSKGKEYRNVFIQDAAGDGNAKTSDAIVVRPTEATKVEVGQLVTASGTVAEHSRVTTIDKATLALAPAGVRDAKVAPSLLELPGTATATNKYLEARESMVVSLGEALVLSPTQSYGTFTVVDTATHGPNKDYDKDDQASHLTVSSALGRRTEVATGDRVTGLVGPLEQSSDGSYGLVQRDAAKVVEGTKPPKIWGDVDGDGKVAAGDLTTIGKRVGESATGPLDAADVDGNGSITATDARLAKARAARMASDAPSFRLVNVNAENFFDTVDNPRKRDTVMSKADFAAKVASLGKLIGSQLDAPALVAMEEVENATVLEALVGSAELKKYGYKFEVLEGPDTRGINTALLYRADQGVSVANVRQLQGTSDLGKTKGGPLFMRPPLTADVTIKAPEGARDEQLTVLVNHFMSAYSPDGKPTEQWRVEQAQFLKEAAAKLQKDAPDANVLVIGDLNANETSKPMELLGSTDSPLENVTERYVPKGERYSYSYMGSAEQLDHVFMTKQMADRVAYTGVHHIHADQPAAGSSRPTDHDIVEARVEFTPAAAK